MISPLIRMMVRLQLSLRYCFWKVYLALNGGSLGRNVTIYSQVKLICSQSNPIFIGDNVYIMQGAIISTARKGRVSIGSGVYIGEYSVITSNGEIIIEDNVMIAPHNNIVDFDHRFKDLGRHGCWESFIARKITIKQGAWIAANCCILKGVTVGESAVVGAGAVVLSDVPAQSLAVGNPAVIKKKTNG